MARNLPGGQRPARPGELCACGRPARTVIETEQWGVVGHCGRTDNPAPVMPCPFCGAARPHYGPYGGPVTCPRYILNPAGPTPTRQRRNVEALCGLLARQALPEICAWWIDADQIKGQLTCGYSDTEARETIRALARVLDNGHVASARALDDTYTRIEAAGASHGVPVSLWTHVDRAERYDRR